MLRDTEEAYSFLWEKHSDVVSVDDSHFKHMQDVIGETIVRGDLGIDVGSGCGYDTYVMAEGNPSSKIVSIDLSNGVYKTKGLTSKLDNVRVIKCSVTDLPFKNNVFDFAYSFGVLHHVTDPQIGLKEVVRIVKWNSPIFLYLYEDHSENFIKHIAVKAISVLRKITIEIPHKNLYRFC